MGKAIQSFWRSVVAQSGWMEHEESQSSDSRQALARDHPFVLVVTVREGEEKGMRSAAMRAVAMVLSRKSTIWRRAIVKTLLRKRQMEYIDVEEMRVVTNDKHIAEQNQK